ncbi:hypothetical protein AGMMS49928_26550 [Spirochaetia bacterium]|nr:hypothetical protein AGMMS49928_26550 [Spirochaetia bacterium]
MEELSLEDKESTYTPEEIHDPDLEKALFEYLEEYAKCLKDFNAAIKKFHDDTQNSKSKSDQP